MFKCLVKRISDNSIVNEATFETEQQVDKWKEDISKRKTEVGMGLKDRWITAGQGDISKAIKTKVEKTEEIEEIVLKEELVLAGGSILSPGDIVKSKKEITYYLIPASYKISIKDITADIQADILKEEEIKLLKEQLKSLKESDMDTVAKLKGVVRDLIKAVL